MERSVNPEKSTSHLWISDGPTMVITAVWQKPGALAVSRAFLAKKLAVATRPHDTVSWLDTLVTKPN